MAIDAGDVLRFTVVQSYDSQQVLNVFYYKVGVLGVSTLTPAEIAENFWDSVKVNWRGCAAIAVTFDKVVLEDLDGDFDYGEYVISGAERAGLASGVSMASYEAYAIKLNRTSRLTRNGAKRLVGVTETQVDAFGLLTSGMFNALQLLADDFATDLRVGVAVLAEPVIVGFPNAHRALRVEVPIDAATAAAYTSTQNTRKRGRGS